MSLIAIFSLYTGGISKRRRDIHNFQVRKRIEAFYQRGHELYVRLAKDPTIPPERTRLFVAKEWVLPVAEYLKDTLGEQKATFFMGFSGGQEPDEESVRQLGLEKAVARARIMNRLERLRKITASL